MLKPKNLSIVPLIQILCQIDIMSIDTLKQNLESIINKLYHKMDSKNLVTIISQMITYKVCPNHHN